MIRESTGTEPFLYVVRGNAAPDEIAALVVVLMNLDSEQDARHAKHSHRRRRATWAYPAHQHRHPWHRRYPGSHG
jgi:hypothetical protein